MSQGAAGGINLATNAYTQILPLLRRLVGSGALVFAVSAGGAMIVGPPGAVAGAAAGGTAALYGAEIIAAIGTVWQWILRNPMLVTVGLQVLQLLRRLYRERCNSNNQVADRAHPQ